MDLHLTGPDLEIQLWIFCSSCGTLFTCTGALAAFEMALSFSNQRLCVCFHQTHTHTHTSLGMHTGIQSRKFNVNYNYSTNAKTFLLLQTIQSFLNTSFQMSKEFTLSKRHLKLRILILKTLNSCSISIVHHVCSVLKVSLYLGFLLPGCLKEAG